MCRLAGADTNVSLLMTLAAPDTNPSSAKMQMASGRVSTSRAPKTMQEQLSNERALVCPLHSIPTQFICELGLADVCTLALAEAFLEHGRSEGF